MGSESFKISTLLMRTQNHNNFTLTNTQHKTHFVMSNSRGLGCPCINGGRFPGESNRQTTQTEQQTENG